MRGFDLIYELWFALFLIVKPHDAPSVPAVPQAIVLFASVRRFIIHQQHIPLSAKNLRFHDGVMVLLPHMPDDQILLLFKGKRCLYHQVQL